MPKLRMPKRGCDAGATVGASRLPEIHRTQPAPAPFMGSAFDPYRWSEA